MRTGFEPADHGRRHLLREGTSLDEKIARQPSHVHHPIVIEGLREANWTRLCVASNASTSCLQIVYRFFMIS
jgi:hypothetical protein